MLTSIAVLMFSTSCAATGDIEAADASTDTAQVIKQLQEQVQNLQGQVDDLKAKDNSNWLTEQRAAEIRGLVEDVLADADTRASLLDTGITAGYDKGFFIGSSDGNYLLKIGGQLQVRWTYDHQNDSPTDDNRSGFEIRRLKLFFGGNVIDKTWEYLVELDADRGTGNVTVGEWAYFQKDFGDGLKVRAGQFKAPYLREEYVSSKRLFLVERSLINAQFTAGITQGVQLSCEAEHWRAFGTYNDGNNQRGTAFTSEDTEWAFTTRVEWLAAGDWKSTEDYDGWRGGQPSILLGAAIDAQNAEYGTGNNLPLPDFNNAEVQNIGLTIDLSTKFNGFSASAAFIYRNLDSDLANLNQYGVIVQAGVFLTETIELAARYEWGDADLAVVDNLSILTVGLNKYFSGQNLKWQNDFGYGFSNVSPFWAQEQAGWRADAPGENGQIVIRSQFQLLF